MSGGLVKRLEETEYPWLIKYRSEWRGFLISGTGNRSDRGLSDVRLGSIAASATGYADPSFNRPSAIGSALGPSRRRRSVLLGSRRDGPPRQDPPPPRARPASASATLPRLGRAHIAAPPPKDKTTLLPAPPRGGGSLARCPANRSRKRIRRRHPFGFTERERSFAGPRILASWQAHTIDTHRTPPAPFTSTMNASTATSAATMLPRFSRGMTGRRIPSSPGSRRLLRRSASAKRPSTVARSRRLRGRSRRDASSRLHEEPCPLNHPVEHSKRPLCKESRVWEIHYDPCRFG